ncbi:MAG: hypothetical protein SF097_27840 [Acidobacteriota bacterium]|nr:hypothetical protein [Acidobacteriota bacterium]
MQSEAQTFEFDLANFLHTPALLKGCLLSSAIGLGLVALTAFFYLRKFRGLFGASSVLTSGWYLLLTFGIARFGIFWPANTGSEVIYGGVRHIVVISRAADFVYLVAWYSVSVLLAIGVQSITRKWSERCGQFGMANFSSEGEL